jgi:hypothetical protein
MEGSDPGFELGQLLDQVSAGGDERLLVDGVECAEDEQRSGGTCAEPRAVSLAPVPAPAGDSCAVPPHDLSGIGVLHDLLAVGHRVELLLARGAYEVRRAFVTGSPPRGIRHGTEIAL